MADVNRIPRLGMVNAYLVREDDGLTLIDTMLGGSAGKIIAGAEVSGAPIVRILLTHAHADHIGSLDALKERLPEAEVIISTRDARLLAKDMSLDPDEPKTSSAAATRVPRPSPTEPSTPAIGSARSR
jgi:glyoxylase-like metal-dependent hydrolase (beta-lactamase superfamily II)